MLDFRRNHRLGSPSGFNLPGRLLIMLGLSAVALFIVLRARDSSEEPAPTRPAPRREAQVGQLALTDHVPDEDRSTPLFPGVRSDYLDSVRDDTVFRAAESDAWFHLLELLEKTDPAQLAAASLGRVGYLQLDAQSPSYRGRVVTIDGVVRKAKPIAAPDNGYGIKQYFQLWLQPERTAPELLVLYVLQLPQDFPEGDALDAPVRATGFFFKRWAYTAQDGIRTAPLLVARTVDWKPPPVTPVARPVGEQFVLALVSALIVAVLVVAVLVTRGRRPKRSLIESDAPIAISMRDDEAGGEPAASDRTTS